MFKGPRLLQFSVSLFSPLVIAAAGSGAVSDTLTIDTNAKTIGMLKPPYMGRTSEMA